MAVGSALVSEKQDADRPLQKGCPGGEQAVSAEALDHRPAARGPKAHLSISRAEPQPSPKTRSLCSSFPLKYENCCSRIAVPRAGSPRRRPSVPRSLSELQDPSTPHPEWEPTLYQGPQVCTPCEKLRSGCCPGQWVLTSCPSILSSWQTCGMVLTCCLHRRLQLHSH